MKNTLLLALVVSSFVSGCTAGASYGIGGGFRGPSYTAVVPSTTVVESDDSSTAGGGDEPGTAYGPGEDRHWFAADDLLVQTKPDDDGSVDMHVGKMTGAPSNDTKNEARFLMASGKERWSAIYFRSRPAEATDLAVGGTAFCYYPATYGVGIDTKQESRTSAWVMARVTDTSALYRGIVSIGKYACPLKAARVPVR